MDDGIKIITGPGSMIFGILRVENGQKKAG